MVNTGCGQSAYGSLKLTVSEAWTDRNCFLCWYRCMKLKSWSKVICVGMVKNGCGQSGHRALKLILSQKWDKVSVGMVNIGCGQSAYGSLKLTVSEAWTDRNCFLCWYRCMKLKSWSKVICVGMVKNGCGQSGHRALKLILSQKWIDGINLFLVSWYKFRKAKIWVNGF